MQTASIHTIKLPHVLQGRNCTTIAPAFSREVVHTFYVSSAQCIHRIGFQEGMQEEVEAFVITNVSASIIIPGYNYSLSLIDFLSERGNTRTSP